MRYRCAFLVVLVVTLGLFGTTNARADRITVFAAASLKDALDAIARAQDEDVTFSFAGSGTLARQIAAGAPADVVILAHSDWMDWLDSKTPTTQRRDIASNRLVLAGAKGAAPLPDAAPQTLLDRLGDTGRLAIGQTDSVPAGLYGKAWLQDIGAWEALRPRLAEVENVRASLALLARGEVPLALVYHSDVQADTSVQTLYEVPARHHPPIRYPAAALTDHGLPFTQFLTSPTAAAILAEHGFIPAHRAPE